MGLCASKVAAAPGTTAAAAPGPPKVKSEFDLRVTAALKRFQETSKDKSKSEQVSSFNQVLLRSGRITKALNALRDVFKKFDADESGSIDHEELGSALEVLGNKMSKEELKNVFHEADIYNNNKLSEKEFTVCLLLGYILDDLKLTTETVVEPDAADDGAADGAAGGEGGGGGGGDGDGDGGGMKVERKKTANFYGHAKELQWAFNNITGCYLLFDVDASGDLSRDEVMGQLKAKKGVFADAAAAQVLSEERWKELDWDGDGEITFREFIWAFQGWIATEEDDEE